MSLFQTPTLSEPGESRLPLKIPPSGGQSNVLPDGFAYVPDVCLTSTNVYVPERHIRSTLTGIKDGITEELRWVMHSLPALESDAVVREDAIAWSAYHAMN